MPLLASEIFSAQNVLNSAHLVKRIVGVQSAHGANMSSDTLIYGQLRVIWSMMMSPIWYNGGFLSIPRSANE